ncbi:TRAF-type zinc finger [Cooperia oncophora]
MDFQRTVHAQCAIRSALRAPVVTQCGHSFCKECISFPENGYVTIKSATRRSHQIHLNRTRRSGVRSNHYSSSVHLCETVANGAELFKEMQKHADSCPYHGVACPNCNKTVPERDMSTHLVECQKNVGKCPYCDIVTTSMEKHLKVCIRKAQGLLYSALL